MPTPHMDFFHRAVAKGHMDQPQIRTDVVNSAMEVAVNNFALTPPEQIALVGLLSANIEQYLHGLAAKHGERCRACRQR